MRSGSELLKSSQRRSNYEHRKNISIIGLILLIWFAIILLMWSCVTTSEGVIIVMMVGYLMPVAFERLMEWERKRNMEDHKTWTMLERRLKHKTRIE